MLRIRIELASHDEATVARVLKRITIENVGGTPERGTYSCVLRDDLGIPLAHAVINDWPRQERDAAALLHEALSRLLDNR